jgi:hypothetical protein
MIQFVAAVVIVAAISGCQPGPQPSRAPTRKGDGIGHNHPEYPTAPAPDPRTSNGRWMVYAIGEEGSRQFVTCWRDSDPSTFRQVDITPPTYHEFLRHPDTGALPCPPS